MCCLLTTLLLLGPRLAVIFWWLFNPVFFNRVFSSFIWPILGIVFVPFTTLMYLIVWPGGISVFEWIFIALALLIDLGSYGGGAYGNRGRLMRYDN